MMMMMVVVVIKQHQQNHSGKPNGLNQPFQQPVHAFLCSETSTIQMILLVAEKLMRQTERTMEPEKRTWAAEDPEKGGELMMTCRSLTR